VEPTQPRTLALPIASLKGRRLFAGGTAGNELLTIATGAVLIGLLAVIGVTILRIGSLLSVHLFVGLVLVGPLVLKMASTGYRFVRYYTRNPRYVEEGPPPTPLRLIAPIVVISTVVVMASGVALLIGGPSSRSTFYPIHKLSFFVWVAFTALHVVGHLPDLWRGLSEDYGTEARWGEGTPGRSGRAMALASAITLGVVLALLLIRQFSPWLHADLHHGHFHVHA
jgi:hypothetical protein